MSGYPVQPAKVQRPPLRDETLARDRLLDWLNVKIHHRVVFVCAEAGYGKTTLLADFSRRTRHRTVWYRLDDEDRNWIAFLSYLVAAGRELQPDFAPTTAALLQDFGTGGPQLESVLETFVREFRVLGDAGAVVVLDDFHAVEEAPDVRLIMQTLLARAPERVTFLIASRRTPSLPVGRLRALGEVAELTTDDLRFNPSETERLFRETYGRPLETDVLDDLARRTEGWAASLQLVQTAIRGRSAGEIRSFVRGLSGAEGDLYDYLAEEVIGSLPDDLQDFLMRISIVETMAQPVVAAVTSARAPDISRLTAAAERAGLLARSHHGHRGRISFHPLVRQFLAHRLRREIGEESVRRLHLAVANAPDISWDVSCHHLAEAGATELLHDRLSNAVRDVLGGGRFELAAEYVRRYPPGKLTGPLAMILSRAELQAGRPGAAVELAGYAHTVDPSPLAAINFGSILTFAGDLLKAVEVIRAIRPESLDAVLREIASALEETMLVSLDASLDEFVSRVSAMAERQRLAGLVHYEGVSLLNGATALRAQGQARRCLDFATRAVDSLTRSSGSSEAISAELAREWALAHLGMARELESIDVRLLPPDMAGEALSELATIEVWYGERARARDMLEDSVGLPLVRPDVVEALVIARAELALRERDLALAGSLISQFAFGEFSPEPGHKAHHLAVIANFAIQARRDDAESRVADALRVARNQQASFWTTYVELLQAVTAGSQSERVRLPEAAVRDPAYLSVLAEHVSNLLDRLSPEHRAVVAGEASRRPTRWRDALRFAATDADCPGRWQAADILNQVGEQSDVALLRELSRTAPAASPFRSLGRALARSLAPRVSVEDQGRVAILIDGVRIDGTSIRRKVLALLCFLLTRTGFSATRDEVLDALWPDLEPDVAANSLNQTIYFLRRVFEPAYQEQTSPGYVHLDSNVIWLDQDLVSSRSGRCVRVLKSLARTARPSDVEELVREYRGKFALDFAYEEWSLAFRDALHASYLQVVETAITADTATGDYARAIGLARAALEVDPTAENVEASLVRLYRMSGAHAAAAEQYAHYSSVLRDQLGLDAPPIDAV